MAHRLKLRSAPHEPPTELCDTARAYDTVAAAYLDYAEGRQAGLFDFHGAHGVTDCALWGRLDAILVRMWAEGRRAIRIFDAGCGPGSWLLRLVLRARDLGFAAIEGVGVDLSPTMIAIARSRVHLAADAHIGLRFDIADLNFALDEEDEESFDIVLCLNGVVNHLAAQERHRAAAAMERVCGGEIFVTAYSVGGSPSIYLADACDARQFAQDHERDQLVIHLQDGRHLALPSHLFRAQELADLFSKRMAQLELIGLDLFHARFGDNPRWNPKGIDHSRRDAALDRLERLCEGLPEMVDFASQILLHGRCCPA
jgi:SAM-dependent methyltransferase